MHSLRDMLRFFAYHFRRMIWPLKRPPWPKNRDGRVYVHIGSGFLHDERFINVDIQPYKSIHLLSDGKRIGLPSSSADLIYTSHVIEHFSHRETLSVLSEWCRILKPLGTIFISVPDFSKLSKIYNDSEDVNDIKMFLMGSQGNPFDFHYNIFDESSLTAMLKQVGLIDIQHWEDRDYSDYPFEDYAHYESTRIVSLNLKARKPLSVSCT